VTQAGWPEGAGIRVDTHIESGARVPPYYDSLLAKIIAQGPDRASALERLRTALGQTCITGVETNLAFQLRLLSDPEFAAGAVDTGFVERVLARARLEQES